MGGIIALIVLSISIGLIIVFVYRKSNKDLDLQMSAGKVILFVLFWWGVLLWVVIKGAIACGKKK